MQPSELFGLVATFAAAVLLVVGVTAGAAVVLEDGSDASEPPEAPAFDAGSLQPAPVSDDGTVPVTDGETEKTVVVDLSHGNQVDRGAIQPLVDSLVAGGHEVRFFTGGSSSVGIGAGSGESPLNGTLRDADAFVVVNPATPYTDDEVNGVEAFADAGGRVLLLADTPTQATSSTAIIPGLPTGGATAAAGGQPTNLAGRFGVTFGSGYLYDMTDNANNFQYVYSGETGSDDVVAGAERTVHRKAVPVVASDDSAAVLESANVRHSSTRKNGTYAVAVRQDSVLAVGDTWFLSPEASTLADNERLVGNVASFLVTGEKEPGAPTSAQPQTPTPPGAPQIPGNGTTTPPTTPTVPEPGNATNSTA